jgi:hypothetical protein
MPLEGREVTSPLRFALYAAAAVTAALACAALLRGVWLSVGAYRIWRAGPRPLHA